MLEGSFVCPAVPVTKSAGKLESSIGIGVSPVDNQVFSPDVEGPDVPKESVAAVVTKSVGKLESNIGKGVSPVDNHVVLSAVVGSDAPDEVIGVVFSKVETAIGKLESNIGNGVSPVDNQVLPLDETLGIVVPDGVEREIGVPRGSEDVLLVIGFGVSPTLDAAAPVVGIGLDCGLVDVVAVLIGCGVS